MNHRFVIGCVLVFVAWFMLVFLVLGFLGM